MPRSACLCAVPANEQIICKREAAVLSLSCGGTHLGTRQPPKHTLLDVAFLRMLPARLSSSSSCCRRPPAAAAAAARHAAPSSSSSSSSPKRRKPKQQQSQSPTSRQPQQQPATARDELGCAHFGACSGCSLERRLHEPPLLATARDFFAARGLSSSVEDSSSDSSSGFAVVPGQRHEWRCRAKLAVRGRPGVPLVGLFAAGSHDVVAIPDCRAHHPRINAAVQLLQQLAAALRTPIYREQQLGGLRYVQLTAVPCQPGERAEDDAAAQIQLVLVWAAPDLSHPSVADAHRLADALWRQAGSRPPDPLAQLRARAEQRLAASSASTSASSRASARSSRQAPAKRSSSSSSSSGGGGGAPGGALSQQVPLLHSVHLNLQPDVASNAVLGHTWQQLAGSDAWGWQDFGGVALAVGAASFVQANYSAMQACLAALVAATPRGSVVLELYAGAGVIGLALAAAGAASRVVCVELNPGAAGAFAATQARLAASKPAAAAAVSHVVGSAGDARLLARLLGSLAPDVVVVDPPRKGLDKAVLAALTQPSQAPPPVQPGGEDGGTALQQQQQEEVRQQRPAPCRLLYVSCGFAALMRDTDALLEAGWRLVSASGFVFFVGTDSLETLAVFERG